MSCNKLLIPSYHRKTVRNSTKLVFIDTHICVLGRQVQTDLLPVRGIVGDLWSARFAPTLCRYYHYLFISNCHILLNYNYRNNTSNTTTTNYNNTTTTTPPPPPTTTPTTAKPLPRFNQIVLIIFKVNGRWVVHGVVSFGASGCHPTRYTVFTRVSSYLNWIYQRTGGKYTR